MDTSLKSYRNELKKIKNESFDGGMLTLEEATDIVQDYVMHRLSEERREAVNKNKEDEKVKKDKAYLREKKKKMREMIYDCIREKRIQVREYTGTKINDFVDLMTSEFAGYSVLEDAFSDPGVSDIFVIDWETIFVERHGKNERYHKSFKSPKHFEDTLKRFLNEAGKEINAGEGKIIDFELYQDRGAATHPDVSPRGYSLTMRKHTEEHITRNQLLGGKVVDEKLVDLLGILILGESNMICAGLTGSGKTTTVRAVLDHYITKANKRMLVAEDTQELFPQNPHTLELVSVKSDDPKNAVPLQNLIYTALRLKPKYIVVGEVRGVEAEAAVEGMETGHSTIFTMHGGAPMNIINRLTTKYLTSMSSLSIDVVERIIGSGVDYIFIQDNIPGIGRKVTSLTEVSYDFGTRRVDLKTICRFDVKEQKWVWENPIGEEKIDKMLRRGIKYDELKRWIEVTN